FDLTAIDFTSNEPVVLKLKAPSTRGTVLVSMLALPKLGEINQTVDNVCCYDGRGFPAFQVQRNRSVDVGVTFRVVQRTNDNDNTLFTIEVSK
ncbi:MAG: hypothetical protein IKE29_05085, partial [Paenibacillus sp.]|uniref:hypothetical protein n=1 Tax=Paenibacillus sp. TaxID=58172 RepID=UPI0025FC69A3